MDGLSLKSHDGLVRISIKKQDTGTNNESIRHYTGCRRRYAHAFIKTQVLHTLAGMPMLEHVYNTSKKLGARQVQVVYGHGGDQLKQQCQHFDVDWVLQADQLGTAHAVQQASPNIAADDVALILYGDVPLTKAETLQTLVKNVSGNNISLLTVNLDDPTGYGRIVREAGKVTAIVEHKDASDEHKRIKEVNTGIFAVNAGI